MDWRNLRIVAFDTETTGLHPEEGHRVVEFAGVELRLGAGGSVEAEPFQFLCNPEMPIPRESSEISGIKDEDVAEAPVFAELASRVHRMLDGAVTIAHNYPFDQRFLTSEFARVNLRWPAPLAEIDTVDLSRAFYPEARSHKLGELCGRLDVSLVGAHRATNDAEACGRCFIKLTRRFDAPADIAGMVEWAGAIGVLPDTGHLGRDREGRVVFLEGEDAGRPVEENAHVLSWMTMARVFENGRWRMRYPDAVVSWARRWLRARASGRASPSSKSLGPADWGIDPPLGAPL